MTAPKLVVLRETTLRDIPATLRNIAASIEAGAFGKALGCAVVLEADGVEVFYCGDGEAGPNTHLLLSVGAAKMVARVLEGKCDAE